MTVTGEDLDATTEFDPFPGGRFPLREQLDADAALYAKFQYKGAVVMVEAFTMAVCVDPDEPVPYYLDEKALAVPCPPDQP